METLVQRALMALVSHCRPEAVLLVGSAAETDVVPHDIDLLVLSGSGTVSTEALSSVKDDLLANDCICSDDTHRFLSNGVPDISVAFMATDSVVRELATFSAGENVAGERRYWAPGCRLPEAFAGDVLASKILYGEGCVLSQMKRLLMPYPEAARKALLEYCEHEISAKLELLEAFPDNELNSAVVRGDLIIAFARAAYAVSGEYLRGLKRIQKIESSLSVDGKVLLEVAKVVASTHAHIPFDQIQSGLTHIRRLYALERTYCQGSHP